MAEKAKTSYKKKRDPGGPSKKPTWQHLKGKKKKKKVSCLGHKKGEGEGRVWLWILATWNERKKTGTKRTRPGMP